LNRALAISFETDSTCPVAFSFEVASICGIALFPLKEDGETEVEETFAFRPF